ncbi:adenylate/guanylate cyclase domain-containing protein [Spongiimicrobium sp. 3-5]|uniref:adenylate/guanylate cyclase domain-containing protein n=1 Tax=Spongiimicrobium sp. 3-5 TaxID=3332596 RepID=UPI00397F79DA
MTSTFIKSLVSWIAGIGSHPDDREEVRVQKTLLIAFAGSMAIMACFWGLLYLYFGEPLAASIPSLYAAVSLISIALFAKIKNYQLFLVSQLAFSLILPFILMLTLGGYAGSSAVIIWSLTSPLGALVLQGRSQALWWFFAFIGLLVVALLLEGQYTSVNNLPTHTITGFFVMNIAGMSLTSFIVLRYFVGEKNLAITMLESKHKWIKEAFSAYVSPNLVTHLIQHPDELRLGGERRECTFIFTDLVGFTPLVEKSDPATLVTYLNEYFEGMIAIVFKHEGTVSKIVGDAIAVMFSAPVVQKDHAARAVACALDMDAYAQNFALEKQKIGLDLGRTRIGVNTGTVIIGNIGGKNQLDYRALGDAINTAARLESANKQLGTRVCVSGTTVAQCPDFIGRPIGSLLLKGKTRPVATFEPLTKSKSETPNISDYLEAYKLMENNAPEALGKFKGVVEDYPEDGLASFHLSRLNSGKSGSTIILPWK